MPQEPLRSPDPGVRPDTAMHGLRWIGTARLFTQLVTWSLTIFTVRLLQPRDYGIVATSSLFTVLATLILDGGLSAVLISRREVAPLVQGAAVSAVLLLSIALAGLIALMAPAGATFFHSPALTSVLQVSALQLPLTALTVVPTAMLAKQLHFRQLALAQSLASVVQGIATLSLAYVGAAYWALIWGTLIGISVRMLLQWGFLQNRPRPNLKFGLLEPLLASGSQMVGQRVLYFITADFDTFALGRFGGPIVLGSYSLAKTLSHSALDQLSGVINQVSMPAFAAKIGDPQAQIDGLLLVIAAASFLVFPLFWLMGVISQVAFPLIFGSRWASMVVPFMAFTCILPLRSVYTLLDSAIVGAGRISTTFRNMLVWTAIMVPLLAIGARFGANTAALMWVVGFPLVFGFAMWRIAYSFKTKVRILLQPMLRPALCAAASGVVVELVQLEASGFLRPIARLILEIALGGFCYWIFTRQCARPQYELMHGLTRRLLGR
jgi:teichuronic acid exporter